MKLAFSCTLLKISIFHCDFVNFLSIFFLDFPNEMFFIEFLFSHFFAYFVSYGRRYAVSNLAACSERTSFYPSKWAAGEFPPIFSFHFLW